MTWTRILDTKSLHMIARPDLASYTYLITGICLGSNLRVKEERRLESRGFGLIKVVEGED